MRDEPLTEQWCRKHLEDYGYKTREDVTAVEFVVAQCSNGSDAMVAFSKSPSRPSQKNTPKCFVSNFYVERIKTVGDLSDLACALGYGNCLPWSDLAAAPMSETKGDE